MQLAQLSKRGIISPMPIFGVFSYIEITAFKVALLSRLRKRETPFSSCRKSCVIRRVVLSSAAHFFLLPPIC